MAKRLSKKNPGDDLSKGRKPPRNSSAARKPPAPDHLTMRLFAPGMSGIHRAGLGGLACTLKAMEKAYREKALKQSQLPAAFVHGAPPWEISDRHVTLKFGAPENAQTFLEKLFQFAFQIRKEGLIFLPGQHTSEPQGAVLADLQLGLLLTFLQHGRVRKLATEETTIQFSSEEELAAPLFTRFKRCSSFRHQADWKELASKQFLDAGPFSVEGPISPGTVVRHVAFTSQTGVREPAERVLPLYFAIVGCVAIPVNRGVAALIVPDVVDLREFAEIRPMMTPTTAQDCLVANGADAGFRCQSRAQKRASPSLDASVKTRAQATISMGVPGCQVMTLMPTAWASQQKSRVATIRVGANDRALERFQIAMSHLGPRVVTKTLKETGGKRRGQAGTERQETFRVDSVVRPMVAENLAVGRPWYQGFVRLMTKVNPATDKPYRNQLSFERKGLHAMTAEENMWDEKGEALVVKAVHEAIRQSLGRIREDTDGKEANGLSQATKNRWERFREKLRLDLAGAKTASHVRFALMDLFSRGGSNRVLRTEWEAVLPVIQQDWQLARDLGLLALASYAGRGDSEEPNGNSESSK